MLDIRNNTVKTDMVQFRDEGLSILRAAKDQDIAYVEMLDYEGDAMDSITSQQDAENFIKALQYAIDQGWFE